MTTTKRKVTSIHEKIDVYQNIIDLVRQEDVLVRDKLELLKYWQKGMAFDSQEFETCQKYVHEFEARMYYIKVAKDSVVGLPALVTLKPISRYMTKLVIEATENTIKLANREFFGRNTDGKFTGVVMIENRSKYGNSNDPHAHCVFSSPNGFTGKSELARLRTCFESVLRTQKVKPATDSDKASLKRIVTDIRSGHSYADHYKIHDKYGRCMFPCLDVRAINDLDGCVDYLTKNIMHPDVVSSDAGHGAGLYKVEYPVGLRGDKGNRPQLVRV
jgi:hypothetical protein